MSVLEDFKKRKIKVKSINLFDKFVDKDVLKRIEKLGKSVTVPQAKTFSKSPISSSKIEKMIVNKIDDCSLAIREAGVPVEFINKHEQKFMKEEEISL